MRYKKDGTTYVIQTIINGQLLEKYKKFVSTVAKQMGMRPAMSEFARYLLNAGLEHTFECEREKWKN